MNKRFLKYSVIFFDEETAQESSCQGLVYGSSFKKAMKNLETYYGADNLIKVCLQELDIETDPGTLPIYEIPQHK